jgi:GAF domain-containing protein
MPVRTDYFKTICTLGQAFGMAKNRKELLTLIFDGAINNLQGKAACLYLAEAGRKEMVPLAQKGLSETYFRSAKSLLARKIVPLVLEKGFFYSLEATQDSKLGFPDATKDGDLVSVQAVPVMVKGRNIGVFCLFADTPRELNDDEKQFLNLLAQQVGGVIEHARLLDRSRQETKLFFDLAVDLSGSLDVKEILRALTENLAKALGVKAASIRLLDESKQTLELVSSYGLSERYLQKGPVSAHKSIAQALNGQQPVIIDNAATDRRVQYRKVNREEGIVSILSVPIKTKEKVIGVLRLYSAQERKFGGDEIKMVTALAYLGGLAIQNASLYLMCQTDMKDLQDELWSHRSWF